MGNPYLSQAWADLSQLIESCAGPDGNTARHPATLQAVQAEASPQMGNFGVILGLHWGNIGVILG